MKDELEAWKEFVEKGTINTYLEYIEVKNRAKIKESKQDKKEYNGI